MLTESDLKQIQDHGLTVDDVVKQLQTYNKGISKTPIITPASIDNGICKLDREQQQYFVDYYDQHKVKKDIVKFVPASGAATRMFKFLHSFLKDYDPASETLKAYLKRTEDHQLKQFLDSLKELPFVNEVRKKIRSLYPDYKHQKKGLRSYLFVKTMLEADGLNYSSLPKGLIPFHRYTKYWVTAFEEQLYEAAFYASANDKVFLHFTFSEEHLSHFKQTYDSIRNRVSKKTKKEFHISYSFQKKSTDTLAVTTENQPFRDESGQLVLRPSGHGALIENLNDVDADIVFIKNIDNVVVESYVDKIAFQKKVLAGKLLKLQHQIFAYAQLLENEDPSLEKLKEINAFIWKELNVKDLPNSKIELQYILNRPLRVCGVVRNTGATGGGPFWVKNETGNVSLQIVESAQIDLNDPHQRQLLNDATHFNPVDIVCGVRDYQGKTFDLSNYIDHRSGFIAEKSWSGRSLKALELPGLWNGAMAKWNTAFIEVPLITFNPVKTVNDLLNKEHLPTTI
ncbi:MAG: DUF4301 family protein [Flavobacteriaceae bacterium]|nr:DUF4301 family protein [Flavobacteriaceae bacterium]